jgi:hypothetical protein
MKASGDIEPSGLEVIGDASLKDFQDDDDGW